VGDTLAFIGLGAMGSGMATCLVRKGFVVHGYDVRGEPAEALRAAGGRVYGSPAEAALGANVALVIVLTADQAENAIFGEDGVASTLTAGSVVVCMTTMSPSRTRDLASRAEAESLRWLDAPVSGGTLRAAEGTLTTMVGGDKADLDRVRHVVEGFSK
jgi:3-hydroxyisobutyrate dehydrogenase